MKSRVTIDARWLVGGIGTYTRHLLDGLRGHGDGIEVHAITRERHREVVEQWCPRVTVVNIPIYTMREQWAIPQAAKGCDLLHAPHYNAPLLHRGPLLVSILDIIHISDPSYRQSFKSWLYARPMLNLAARKAEHIVTLSEYSKTQIVERLGVPPSKVTTIYCGVNGQFRCTDRKKTYAAVSSALGIQEPYFLYVGNLKPHKNVSILLRAFERLRTRHDIPHRLLIIGDDARCKPALVEECARLGIEAATLFVPYVAPELLPNLYAGADLLVMPSRIEGFGLPVLEAMASGTPVVCSRAASLPEVAGGAALYFDPSSAEELADTIEKVLSSSDLQESLRTKGLERAKKFTWAESTRKHVELYHRLLGMNRMLQMSTTV
jgi:glycosyltransferase involved in cell wall biosynthesis